MLADADDVGVAALAALFPLGLGALGELGTLEGEVEILLAYFEVPDSPTVDAGCGGGADHSVVAMPLAGELAIAMGGYGDWGFAARPEIPG